MNFNFTFNYVIAIKKIAHTHKSMYFTELVKLMRTLELFQKNYKQSLPQFSHCLILQNKTPNTIKLRFASD